MNERAQKAVAIYLALVKVGPAAVGDFASLLDDETAKAVYEILSTNSLTDSLLVRPLWFNYETQKMRWE